MMLPKMTSQRGQALILVVAAILALVALTALAIDGGHTFSDRRHAQNAADTSALAAALTKIQALNEGKTAEEIQIALQNAALYRAASNGYNNDGLRNNVSVNNPPSAACNGSNGPYSGNAEYIQVIIRSTVDTFFAPILGIDQLHNCVEAIARVRPAAPPAEGAAIVSLGCGGKWDIRAGGATEIVVHGGGVFSNSNHAEAIYIQKPTNLQLDPGYKAEAVGCVNVPEGYPYQCHVPARYPCPLPAEDPLLPQLPYPCDFEIGDFKPPQGTILNPGVYCISGTFQEADNISGTGVTFIMLNQGIAWSGNSTMVLSAPAGVNDSTKGLLIYLPPSNGNAVTLNGTANTKFTGTILAPSSNITISGDLAGVGLLKSSFIGKTVKLTGKGEFTVDYKSGENWQYTPQIELSK